MAAWKVWHVGQEGLPGAEPENLEDAGSHQWEILLWVL